MIIYKITKIKYYSSEITHYNLLKTGALQWNKIILYTAKKCCLERDRSKRLLTLIFFGSHLQYEFFFFFLSNLQKNIHCICQNKYTSGFSCWFYIGMLFHISWTKYVADITQKIIWLNNITILFINKFQPMNFSTLRNNNFCTGIGCWPRKIFVDIYDFEISNYHSVNFNWF